MAERWDPELYARFGSERERPFHELLQRVPAAPRQIADLGCGDGRLTRLMLHRWPEAQVVGIDRSVEMLEKAKAHADPPRLRYEHADLAAWSPDHPLDLIVSNAALHWVPDHARLIPRLLDHLRPGGHLAVQVPLNQDAPSHRAVRAVAADERFAPSFAGLTPQEVLPPHDYLQLLSAYHCEVDLWTTTYHHVLPSPDGVLDWLEGTTLRPYLHRLRDQETAAAFRAELTARLRAAYPPDEGQVAYPFTRLFFVALRPAEEDAKRIL